MMRSTPASVLCLTLLVPVLSAQASRASDTLFGYAQANRLYADGWAGVRFDIQSPFFPVDDAEIGIAMTIRSRDGHLPENVICSLRRDFRYVPADVTARLNDDGDLVFELMRLDAYTRVQLIVAWKHSENDRAYVRSARVWAAGTGWEKSALRQFGYAQQYPDAIPVDIVTEGPEACRLIERPMLLD